MATGSPVTVNSTAPQKHLPLYWAIGRLRRLRARPRMILHARSGAPGASGRRHRRRQLEREVSAVRILAVVREGPAGPEAEFGIELVCRRKGGRRAGLEAE